MSNSRAQKLHKEGVELFRKDQPEAALQKFNDALALYDDTDQARHVAEIYNDVGVVETQLEDFSAARAALDQAMERFTTAGDEKGKAQTLGNRAALHEAEGDMESAVDIYKESAAIFEALGENDMAMYVWQAVSRLRMRQGQYIAAIGAYEEGVDNMPEGSFKRKVLGQILKAPNSLLGGSGGSSHEIEEDDEDEDEGA